MILEHSSNIEKLLTDNIAAAEKYRRLWQCASVYIARCKNGKKSIGEDERRMLARVKTCDTGPLWSGLTDGWID